MRSVLEQSALVLGADGIWRAPSPGRTIDYPDEGNAFCFPIEDHSFWFRHRNHVILDRVAAHRLDGPFLDVGAGNGFVTRDLQAQGVDAVAIEPGTQGCLNARSRGIAQVACATLEEAALPDASVAAVGLFDVLEHIDDDGGVLRRVRRLLRPGGRVYLTVPAYGWLWSTEDELAGHHRRYTVATAERVFVAAGLRPVFSTYLFAAFPAPLFLVRRVPYLCGVRSQPDPETIRQHLQPKENVVTRLIDRMLTLERRHVARGGRLAFGTSVLVEAVIEG